MTHEEREIAEEVLEEYKAYIVECEFDQMFKDALIKLAEERLADAF